MRKFYQYSFEISFAMFFIGCLFIGIDMESKLDSEKLSMALILFSFGSSIFIALLGLKRNTSNQLKGFKKKQKKFLDKSKLDLKTAVKKGNFYKLNGAPALRYIAENINNYRSIKNIRVRAKQNPRALDEAVKQWRKEIKERFNPLSELNLLGKQEFLFEEIIAFDETLSEEKEKTDKAYAKYIEYHTKNKTEPLITYKSIRLSEESLKIQIRNFMLFETRQGTKELYWGWHEDNNIPVDKISEKKFLTYYTTDEEMIEDYEGRFKNLIENLKLHSKNGQL